MRCNTRTIKQKERCRGSLVTVELMTWQLASWTEMSCLTCPTAAPPSHHPQSPSAASVNANHISGGGGRGSPARRLVEIHRSSLHFNRRSIKRLHSPHVTQQKAFRLDDRTHPTWPAGGRNAALHMSIGSASYLRVTLAPALLSSTAAQSISSEQGCQLSSWAASSTACAAGGGGGGGGGLSALSSSKPLLLTTWVLGFDRGTPRWVFGPSKSPTVFDMSAMVSHLHGPFQRTHAPSRLQATRNSRRRAAPATMVWCGAAGGQRRAAGRPVRAGRGGWMRGLLSPD